MNKTYMSHAQKCEQIAEKYEANRLEISKYQDMQFRKDQAEYRKKYLGFVPSSKRWLVGKCWRFRLFVRYKRRVVGRVVGEWIAGVVFE